MTSAAAIMMTSRRLLTAELEPGRAPRTIVAELPPDGAAIGRLLKERGFTATEVTWVVPRHRVLVRRLKVPAGTPEEIDHMVALMLEQELDLPLEEVRYATMVGAPDAEGQVEVSAAALRLEELGAVREQLSQAGLSVVSVVVSTWCLDEVVGPAESGAELLALLEPDFGEVVLLEGRSPRAARSLDAVADGAAGTELVRTVPVLEAQAQTGPVTRVRLIGRRHEQAASELRAAWKGQRDTPVETVEPKAGTAIEPILVPVVGACLARAQTGRAAGPDLLQERVRPSRWRPHRRKLIAGGVAACFVLLWMVMGSWLWIKQGRLSAIQKEISSSKKTVDDLKEIETRIRLLDQWTRPRTSWASVLAAVLEDEAAGRPGAYDRVLHLTSANFWYSSERRGGEETLKVRLAGNCKKTEDANKLSINLRKRAGVISMVFPGADPHPKEPFPMSFTLDGGLTPRRWVYHLPEKP